MTAAEFRARATGLLRELATSDAGAVLVVVLGTAGWAARQVEIERRPSSS